MQHARAQEPIEMSLREHLLAASASGSAPSPYPPTTGASHQGHDHPYPTSDSGSPHDHQLDPNVTGQPLPYAMSGDGHVDDGMSPDSRKGKRELSTSKRAAQNRAAQRAFRQRKEGYIKKLEEQVKDFQTMEQNYKALQNENYQLREYILNLQSRLLENQSDFPPAPSHVNLSASTAPAPSTAETYNAEQQLQREMDQRPQPPPPAPVVAREDPLQRDHHMSELHDAARQEHQRQQQQRSPPQQTSQSPYGLGNTYPTQQPQPRPDDAEAPNNDSKPAT